MKSLKIGKCYKLAMSGYGLFSNEFCKERIAEMIKFGSNFLLLDQDDKFVICTGETVTGVKILYKGKIHYTFFRQTNIVNDLVELL